MSLEHLSPLQEKLLEMLSWYHDFCLQHNLRYYAIGGTMLGAVRHQGFIPWDDDIDVGMPRADYERFISLLKSPKKGDRFLLETIHMNHADFDFPYAKVYDATTTLIENKKSRPKRGLFIDVFPLDGIGADNAEAHRNFRPIGIRLNLLAARVCDVRKGRSLLKNASVVLARLVPSFLYDKQKEMIRIDRMCAARAFDRFAFVGNLVGSRRSLEIMPIEYFGAPAEYAFENITIYGVEQAEEYLTHLYGDWRKYPPKEQQQSHHVFLYCDLNRSYLED